MDDDELEFEDDLRELDAGDLTDYEGPLSEILTDAVSDQLGQPAVAVNWCIVIDARLTNGGEATGIISPTGTPSWLESALLQQGLEVAMMGAAFRGKGGEWDEDDDE